MLVGGLEHFRFFHSVGNFIIPTDLHIFSEGLLKPPTSMKIERVKDSSSEPITGFPTGDDRERVTQLPTTSPSHGTGEVILVVVLAGDFQQLHPQLDQTDV